MIARLDGDAPDVDIRIGAGDSDSQLCESPPGTDTVPDLTAIWRQLHPLEWEVLDLRRELEAEA
jgi:hypothetical protein